MRAIFSQAKRSICILVCLLFASLNAAHAFDVTFQWDANNEPDLAGYRIYYGFSSRSYAYFVDAGNETSCTLTDLEDGVIHYFAMTAYDIEGRESDFSAELKTDGPPDTRCKGDFDGDGDVDGIDLSTFAVELGRTDCDTGDPCRADFDGDGCVDAGDLALLAADFGRTDCP